MHWQVQQQALATQEIDNNRKTVNNRDTEDRLEEGESERNIVSVLDRC